MKKTIIASLFMIVYLIQSASFVMAAEENEKTPYEIWEYLKENGDLSVETDGLLSVTEINDCIEQQEYEAFLNMLSICNESIQEGVLVVEKNTMNLASTIQPENEMEPYGLSNDSNCDVTNLYMARNGAHGCSVQELNLLNMCANNYNTLKEYYNRMLQLSVTNPNLSPWGATVGYWISKVENGGDWDYKVQSGFAPWYTEFCCYFDSNFNHVTSEYIGNFNYGYTGKFLFSLDVLHTGSSAVSGFDPADTADWPAIDAGYNNAP